MTMKNKPESENAANELRHVLTTSDLSGLADGDVHMNEDIYMFVFLIR